MLNKLIFCAVNAFVYMRYPYLVRRYVRINGRLPNVANPKSLAEKMFWRKTMEKNPLFVVFADKLACKEYIRGRCPEIQMAEVAWKGNDPSLIPSDLLGGDLWLKANHGSSFNFYIPKGHQDIVGARAKAGEWLRSSYGRKKGEWCYAGVERQIFLEENIPGGPELLCDIQIRASNGKGIIGSVTKYTKTPEQKSLYLDVEGNITEGLGIGDQDESIGAAEIDAMRIPYLQAVAFAERLNQGCDYARYDFLWNGLSLYAGEITVFPASGSSEVGNLSKKDYIDAAWSLKDSHFFKSKHSGIAAWYANALKEEQQ